MAEQTGRTSGYKAGDRVRYELFEKGGEPLGIVEEIVEHAEPVWPTAITTTRTDPRWKRAGWSRLVGLGGGDE